MTLSPRVPELGALDVLLSVARLGSLGRAAREHGVSQPAVSSRLEHLEQQVGLALLQRTPLGTTLTPAGAMVVEWARAVVDAAGALDAGIGALRAERDASLRVAASLTVAEYLMPGWLVTLRAERPDSTIRLETVNSAEVVRRVLAREVHLGFVESPENPPGLASRVVGGDELAVVVAPSHPWARRRRPIEIDELAATPLVFREVGSGTREALERLLAGTTERARPLMEVSSTTAIKAAVEAGIGPAVMSSLAVRAELEVGTLVACAVAGQDLHRQLRAVWPAHDHLVGPARDLVSVAARSRVASRSAASRRSRPLAPAG